MGLIGKRSVVLCLSLALAISLAMLVGARGAGAVTPGFASVIEDCGVRPDVTPNKNNPRTVAIARQNTERLNDCLSRFNKIEFDAGHTYIIGGKNGQGVTLKSGKHIKGNGANSKIYLNHLERVDTTNRDPYPSKPKYKGNAFSIFSNAVSNVTLENLYLEGRSSDLLNLSTTNPLQCLNNVDNTDPEVTVQNSRGKNCRMGAGVYLFNTSNTISRNISLLGVQIHDWPGVSARIENSERAIIRNSVSDNPNKGGFVLSGHVISPTIENSRSTNASDGAIGLNGGDGCGGARCDKIVRGEVKIANNYLSTRPKGNGIKSGALHGTAIVIRAARLPSDNIPDVYGNRIIRSINASISVLDHKGVDPQNVYMRNNDINLTYDVGIKMQSIDGTTGMKANGNIIRPNGRKEPRAGIAFVKSQGGGDQRWTNSEAFGNDLNGKIVYVEPGIKGIRHQ